MKLSALATIVTLVATAIAKESSCVYRATDNPEVNLALHKWDNDECMGKSKALHRIEFGTFLDRTESATIYYMC